MLVGFCFQHYFLICFIWRFSKFKASKCLNLSHFCYSKPSKFYAGYHSFGKFSLESHYSDLFICWEDLLLSMKGPSESFMDEKEQTASNPSHKDSFHSSVSFSVASMTIDCTTSAQDPYYLRFCFHCLSNLTEKSRKLQIHAYFQPNCVCYLRLHAHSP